MTEQKRNIFRTLQSSIFYRDNAIPLLFIVVVSTILSMKQIGDEGAISLNGDMPRYLMNGAFVYDVLREFPIHNPLEYAHRYFSKYPALSVGHHPPLLGVVEAPFFAVGGVSVRSGRFTVIFFFLIAIVFFYLTARQIYSTTAAFIATLFLSTNSFIIEYTRMVMSEIPALSLIIVTVYFFQSFLRNPTQLRLLLLTFASLILSILARQQSIFLIPTFLLAYLLNKGMKNINFRLLAIGGAVFVLLLIPFALVTAKYS